MVFLSFIQELALEGASNQLSRIHMTFTVWAPNKDICGGKALTWEATIKEAQLVKTDENC